MLRTCVLATVLCLFALTGAARGSGFLLTDHDAAGTGRGFARTAGVNDAAAQYWNPAATSFLEESEIKLDFHYISTQLDYDPDPGQGFDAEQHQGHFFIPATYAAFDISEYVDAGLAVFVPYALATRYNRNWSGRYQSIDAEVSFIFVQPSISVKIPGIDLALSAGLQLNMNMDEVAPVRLTRALDFRFLGQPDGFIEIEGDSDTINVGYVLSLSWKPSYLGNRVAVGVTWRATPDDHEIDGRAKIQAPASVGLPTRAGAKTSVTLPPYLTVGLELMLIEDQLWVEFGYRWVGWSTLDKLVIEFDDARLATSVNDFGYKNVNQFMFGVEWHPVEWLALRCGYQFDESPANPKFLSPRLPEGDRHGVSVGVGFQTERFSVELAYMHLFFKTATKRNLQGFNSPGGPATANGRYDALVDVVGISFGMKF